MTTQLALQIKQQHTSLFQNRNYANIQSENTQYYRQHFSDQFIQPQGGNILLRHTYNCPRPQHPLGYGPGMQMARMHQWQQISGHENGFLQSRYLQQPPSTGNVIPSSQSVCHPAAYAFRVPQLPYNQHFMSQGTAKQTSNLRHHIGLGNGNLPQQNMQTSLQNIQSLGSQ